MDPLTAELALQRQQLARLTTWCQTVSNQLEADGAPGLADVRNQQAAEIAARQQQIAALEAQLQNRVA